MLEIVAPKVGGFTASDGSRIEADQKIGGGPSVLYDAVVLLIAESSGGLAARRRGPPVRRRRVRPLQVRRLCATVRGRCSTHPASASRLDDGFVALEEAGPAAFVERCRELRFWDRELLVAAASGA